MSLRTQLDQDLKEALKSRDKLRAQTLRSLKSAIKYAEIEAGETFDDEKIEMVLAQQAKQRRGSIAEFEKANREDLIQQEAAELMLIEAYLPELMSPEEIEAKLKGMMAELGLSDMKGMGQLMGRAMAELKGKADGKMINQIARRLLAG